VPGGVEIDSCDCHCGFMRNSSSSATAECFYCNHEIMSEIVRSVAAANSTKRLSNIFAAKV
jgi:hypothetical protein